MIIYFASNCGVPETDKFVMELSGNRLHSFVYQVSKGVPVMELKAAFQYFDGKGYPLPDRFKRKPK